MLPTEKTLAEQIFDLDVRIVPLQSHNTKGDKWFLLTDTHSGEVVDDARSEKIVKILQKANLHFSESGCRLIISDEIAKPVIQEIVDTHEYRYAEAFHAGHIVSISHVMEHAENAQESLFEAISLAGRWQSPENAPGTLCIELGSLAKPVGELIHALNEVDALFFCTHVNHSNILHVLDDVSVKRIKESRERVIKRIGFDHPEIRDMTMRIRDIIMFAQSVQIGAEIKPLDVPSTTTSNPDSDPDDIQANH